MRQQKDRRTQEAKIFIYKDKVTNVPKGECTVTYDDPPSAKAAISWFNGTVITFSNWFQTQNVVK